MARRCSVWIAGDLHALERTRREAGLDDAVRDAERVQLVAGLRDDLAAMRQHQTRSCWRADLCRTDVGGDDGFAAPVGATRMMRLLPAATAR